MADEQSKKNGIESNDQPSNATNEQPEPTEAAKALTAEEQLGRKLAEAERVAESYKDQFLRKAAELENYRRRSEADYINLIRNANEGLLASLLPVLDDFSRSLKSGKDTTDLDAFYKGVELIYNKFSKLLEAQGLTPFESTGKPFDVAYHDALLQTPRSDVPHHTVVEEVERGYRLNDKVIRHAKVIVSTEADAQNKPDAVPRNNEAGESGK